MPPARLKLPSGVRRQVKARKSTQMVPNTLVIMPDIELMAQQQESMKQNAAAKKPEPKLVKAVKAPPQSLRAMTLKNYGPNGQIIGGGRSISTNTSAASETGKPTGVKPGNKKVEVEEDLSTAIKNMGGKVVETIGEGSLLTWVVQFENTEKFLEAERKLTFDRRVASLQRDFLFHNNGPIDPGSLNDPYIASEWYMTALNVYGAWGLSRGSRNAIGVLDSGTNGKLKELENKCYPGYNAVDKNLLQADVDGHGTMVATTAAATADNGVGTAGPATNSVIYPVRVGYADGTVSVAAILRGILKCGEFGVKIINISSNGDPPFTFARKEYNRVLHKYLKWYHDDKGGLVFNSAGNSGTRDPSNLQPYLIVVSALDEDYSLAYFSTYGGSIWFTAPGTNIYCSDRDGSIVSVAGTSFSSPLAASIAALLWGANPGMSNLDIERVMIASCRNAGSRPWNRYFGFGLPDAEKAMKAVLGK